MLGQSSAKIVSGNTFYIGDNTTNKLTDTATNHVMNVAGNYTCGGTEIYTTHSFPSLGWFGTTDIISSGTNYGRITAVTSHTRRQSLTAEQITLLQTFRIIFTMRRQRGFRPLR